MNDLQLRRLLLSSSGCTKCGQPISGVRHLCRQCPDTELCNSCYENQGHESHQNHVMSIWISPVQGGQAKDRQENNNTSVHQGVNCDACNTTPIIGDRFKCTQCLDFDLCSACHAQKKHSQHALRRISKAELGKVHNHITCDSCLITPIHGIRFKCTVCEDVDFCGQCRSNGVHTDHVMATIVKPTPFRTLVEYKAEGQQIHSGILCINCGVLPITGRAFTCSECTDYNLCANCKGAGVHSLHSLIERGFMNYVRPNRIQHAHRGIVCDSCEMDPILGTRYKCVTCPDYDLCESCHAAGIHPHTMREVQVVGMDQVHQYVVCDACNVRPIRGLRFKCTVCKDFDLCQVCLTNNAHPQHPMIEKSAVSVVERREPVHRFIQCDACNICPIRGKRFKCTVCVDFDLCQSCLLRNAHPQHKMIDFSKGTTMHNVQNQKAQTKVGAGSSQTKPPGFKPSTGAGPSASNNHSNITASGPESVDDRLTCGICMDKEKNMAFRCGHSTCSDCGDKVDNCPFCQSPITERFPLFL